MKLKLATKLIGGFMIMVFLLILVGILSTANIYSVKKGGDGIKFSAEYDDAIMSTIITVLKQQDAITDYSLTHEKEVLGEIEELGKEFNEKIENLKKFTISSEEKGAVAELETSHSNFESVGKKMASAFLNGNRDEGLRLMEVFDGAVVEQEKVMEKVENIAMAMADKNADNAESVASRALKQVSIVSIISIILGLGFGIFISRSIAKPVAAMAAAAKAMSEGDLTQEVKVTSSDEIGEMAQSFNIMSTNLNEVVTKINDASSHIASASDEISASSEQMAVGADNQTRQTDQVATAVEEMSATVLEVAKNSNDASESARKAAEVAKTGGDVVEKTLSGMNSIAKSVRESASIIEALGKSSDEIGEIIEVIDDIADQTNLLALNAAIEAARAGDQGRGFAVVADEVRKLAERTTKATKEIASMIKTIQQDTGGAVTAMTAGTEEVEKGVTLANEAGNSLNQIIEVVGGVTSMVTQIATAAEEQSAAAEEISVNVESVASITKETATGAQQSSVATQELSKLAGDLQNIVGKFKLS